MRLKMDCTAMKMKRPSVISETRAATRIIGLFLGVAMIYGAITGAVGSDLLFACIGAFKAEDYDVKLVLGCTLGGVGIGGATGFIMGLGMALTRRIRVLWSVLGVGCGLPTAAIVYNWSAANDYSGPSTILVSSIPILLATSLAVLAAIDFGALRPRLPFVA